MEKPAGARRRVEAVGDSGGSRLGNSRRKEEWIWRRETRHYFFTPFGFARNGFRLATTFSKAAARRAVTALRSTPAFFAAADRSFNSACRCSASATKASCAI